MQSHAVNPELGPYFKLTYLLISVVLIAGASLFFLPDIGPGWFWHPAPFNRRFIGAVYLTELTIVFAVFWWRFRHRAPRASLPVPKVWRYYLWAQGAVIGLYGLAQLAAPEQASGFWPWAIDDFHGRFYSAVFLTLAVSSFLLAGGAAPIEWFALGVAQLIFGAFAILGLVTVDLGLHRVNWGGMGTWLWTGAFGLLLAAGLAMLVRSRRTP